MPESLSLSALQHYLYCPRQCALIHVEKVWIENRFTAEGRILHDRVDSGVSGRRGEVEEERAVPVRSEALGLYGVLDVLEKYEGDNGRKVLCPVEYKRGSSKVEDWDRAQLCAQAMCLEEMLDVTILKGAIFYGKPRRREIVFFEEELRSVVEINCHEMHAMVDNGQMPRAEYGERCRGCSLKSVCMPKKKKRKSVENYLLHGLDL